MTDASEASPSHNDEDVDKASAILIDRSDDAGLSTSSNLRDVFVASGMNFKASLCQDSESYSAKPSSQFLRDQPGASVQLSALTHSSSSASLASSASSNSFPSNRSLHFSAVPSSQPHANSNRSSPFSVLSLSTAVVASIRSVRLSMSTALALGSSSSSSSRRFQSRSSIDSMSDIALADVSSVPHSSGSVHSSMNKPLLDQVDENTGMGEGGETLMTESESGQEIIAGGMVDGTPAHEQDPQVVDYWLSSWSPMNRAVMASSFATGFYIGLSIVPQQYYLSNVINASASDQAVIASISGLPTALKMFLGFISDALPIRGLRRKPYMLIGWLIYVLSNLALAYLATPNVLYLTIFLFVGGLGLSLVDISSNAILVERSKEFESAGTEGHLQSSSLTILNVGVLLGSILSMFVYDPFWLNFAISAAVPLLFVFPFVPQLIEPEQENPSPVSEQLQSIWQLVQMRTIWGPSVFIFLFNALTLYNPAWNNYFGQVLNFTGFEYGLINLLVNLLGLVSLSIYTHWLDRSGWRSTFLVTSFIWAMFSALPIILLFNLVDSRVFQIGVSASSQTAINIIFTIQYLPIVRMFVLMCPKNAEGASFAMLTTMVNLANSVSQAVSSSLTSVWDVSDDALNAGNFSGMWKLTLLATGVGVVPLIFVGLIPNNAQEQADANAAYESSEDGGKSVWAGRAFVAVMSASLVYVVVSAVQTLINPSA